MGEPSPGREPGDLGYRTKPRSRPTTTFRSNTPTTRPARPTLTDTLEALHRLDEVVAGRSLEPRRPRDLGVPAQPEHRLLPGELRPAVDRLGPGRFADLVRTLDSPSNAYPFGRGSAGRDCALPWRPGRTAPPHRASVPKLARTERYFARAEYRVSGIRQYRQSIWAWQLADRMAGGSRCIVMNVIRAGRLEIEGCA